MDLFRTLAEDALDRVADLTQAICGVPAPTGDEMQRARFVAAEMRKLHLDPQIDDLGNVIARRKGRSPGGTVLVAAHLDTVFPPQTDLTVTRTATSMAGPGIGDNCVAVAGMLGLAQLLDAAQVQTAGDVLLVATVGEEGLGNLRGIRAVIDRFESELKAVIAVEGHMLGRVVHQAVGSKRIKVTFTGPGGHSWGAFGAPSAIHAMGTLIHHIASLEPPTQPKTTYNVGLISGGSSINTIAPSASAMIDLRSVDPGALAALADQVETLIEQQRSPQITPHIEVIGERPAGIIPVDNPVVQRAMRVLERLDIEPQLGASSTDANIPIARGIPAVCVGMTRGTGMHRLDEAIELPPIALGLQQLLHLVHALAAEQEMERT